MSGSRTKTGCYSCRIRRKKCDETKPVCLSCSSREITCLGYDARPSWMTGFRSWQDILDSDEAKAIRRSAVTNYNLRRARSRRNNKPPNEHACGALPGAEDEGGPPNITSQTGVTVARGYDPLACMDKIWWDSNMASKNGSATFNFRNVMHFIEVICPLQYGFSSLRYHPNHQDHRWFIDSIIEDEPLYHACSGLSLCLESGRQDGNTSGFCNASSDVRSCQVKAIQGLQIHVNDLAVERQRCVIPPARMVSRVVATILHLLSLEIFNSLGGQWLTHLDAANTVFGLFQKPWLSKSTTILDLQPVPDPVRTLFATPKPTQEMRTLGFYITAFVWTDIMARASHRQRARQSVDFDYRSLLNEGMIRPSEIMGCNDDIMIAICNINLLEAEKSGMNQFNDSSQAQFADRASTIECAIEQRLREIMSDATCFKPGSAYTDSKLVTVIFSHAALVYLSLVTARLDRARAQAHRCLEELEVLPSSLFIRVCWPFVVAGCMVEDSNYDRCRAIIARVIADRQVLGFAWKALIVMEECWRLRREHGGNWCWKTVTQHMGLRILFI